MRAYRLLTAEDTAAFCHKVTEALSKGWELHGSPAYAHDPATGTMRCAQAVIKDVEGEYDPEIRLGSL
ncbi:DUF1737 domain-containing protein [Roseinatronobacter alkalisoli]|uniref:DUF1737 domain-containing protein n=1 Tax=Roseinatronobacter alkalisoli TaxID=3028235 RepID=A0ABT5T593_9RHOB|nr:DUF1737 domain-containing protein [Roseinatronobacter sp. HJB301]MDD7970290.1 DUF1737 domain-containing protein [Roseinatronobacter sp. HJB301]